MTYRIRYIFEEAAIPALPELLALFQTVDPGYRNTDDGEGASLCLGGTVLGRLDLAAVDNPQDSELIAALLDELEELQEEDAETDTEAVEAVLWNATGVLEVEVVFFEEHPRETLAKLNPIWSALLGAYPGLLYAEHEGYYGRAGLVVDLG